MGRITGIVSFEADNRDCQIPVITDEEDFAEIMRLVLYRVATAENRAISASGVLGGKVYPIAKLAFLAAIATAYPEVDAGDVYEVWADCTESVAYCVKVVKRHEEEERLEKEMWEQDTRALANQDNLTRLSKLAHQTHKHA